MGLISNFHNCLQRMPLQNSALQSFVFTGSMGMQQILGPGTSLSIFLIKIAHLGKYFKIRNTSKTLSTIFYRCVIRVPRPLKAELKWQRMHKMQAKKSFLALGNPQKDRSYHVQLLHSVQHFAWEQNGAPRKNTARLVGHTDYIPPALAQVHISGFKYKAVLPERMMSLCINCLLTPGWLQWISLQKCMVLGFYRSKELKTSQLISLIHQAPASVTSRCEGTDKVLLTSMPISAHTLLLASQQNSKWCCHAVGPLPSILYPYPPKLGYTQQASNTQSCLNYIYTVVQSSSDSSWWQPIQQRDSCYSESDHDDEPDSNGGNLAPHLEAKEVVPVRRKKEIPLIT